MLQKKTVQKAGWGSGLFFTGPVAADYLSCCVSVFFLTK